MQIPHFRRPFYPSVWFSFPVPHFRENEGWGSPEQSFDTLWQKKSNLARILGQMVRISQKLLIILQKICLKIPPCKVIVMQDK